MPSIAPQLNRKDEKLPRQYKRVEKETEYPSSDGKPMAESELHQNVMITIILMLKDYFENNSDVYVAGNNFVYTEKGNPSAVVSPDAYVVYGVPKKIRDSYKVWEENGHVPNFVLETSSPKTKRKDLREKYLFYQQLGVQEYFLYDPKSEYLHPTLWGFRLENGKYKRLELIHNRIYSEQLQLEWVLTPNNVLRLFNPATGEYLVDHAEQKLRAEVAIKVAKAEAQRAEFATKRAEAEAQRADFATKLAEAEAKARLEAEEENRRLLAEIAILKANQK